jgi:DNA-binding transcriptional MerR regulator
MFRRSIFIYFVKRERRGRKMTIDEASKQYNIPIEVLEEYESWGLCGEVKKVMGAWQYDGQDLERLSMIMTLHDVGFENGEIEEYMKLLLEGESTGKERLHMLNKKRGSTLDELHLRQKQLDRLDYLRYKIQNAEKRNQ